MLRIGGIELLASLFEAQETTEPSAIMRRRGPETSPLAAATCGGQWTCLWAETVWACGIAHDVESGAANFESAGKIVNQVVDNFLGLEEVDVLVVDIPLGDDATGQQGLARQVHDVHQLGELGSLVQCLAGKGEGAGWALGRVSAAAVGHHQSIAFRAFCGQDVDHGRHDSLESGDDGAGTVIGIGCIAGDGDDPGGR